MDSEKIPCFLCGNQVEVKNTVKGKPYFICDPCGLQAFIRRGQGIQKLKDWMQGKGELFKKKSGGLILELISQLEEVKAKLKEVKDNEGLLPDKDSIFVKEALKSEIEGLKDRIKRGIKHKNREVIHE